jgi:hypothetical protein
MTWLLFAGDMLVMLFMMALVAWVALAMSNKEIEAVASLPLEDEDLG